MNVYTITYIVAIIQKIWLALSKPQQFIKTFWYAKIRLYIYLKVVGLNLLDMSIFAIEDNYKILNTKTKALRWKKVLYTRFL